jgi:hypothetical protein
VLSREHNLAQFGYSDVRHMASAARHAALQRAAAASTPLRVMRRLNALQVLNKARTALADIFHRDRNWVGHTYLGWPRGGPVRR